MARLPVIDFHTHVLPEMDDGSDSVETSIGMLRKLRDSGVALAVATSHYYRWDEDIDSFLERRSEAIGTLRPHMDASCAGIVPAAQPHRGHRHAADGDPRSGSHRAWRG